MHGESKSSQQLKDKVVPTTLAGFSSHLLHYKSMESLKLLSFVQRCSFDTGGSLETTPNKQYVARNGTVLYLPKKQQGSLSDEFQPCSLQENAQDLQSLWLMPCSGTPH